jgi:RimJ/RimL family protein N-acetyltransferase
VPAVLLHGDAGAVQHVLKRFRSRLPVRFELHAFPEHLELVQRIFPGTALGEYFRMRVLASEFPLPDRDPEVLRLTHGDTAELIQLYSRTGISYFDPYQLETGLYFGIRKDGQLVSVAGVHAVSEEDKVAAIGNVATHPDWRGAGLSRRCTTRLLRALVRRHVETIVLNVDASNTAALRLYRSIGFREHTRVFFGRIGPAAPPVMGR